MFSVCPPLGGGGGVPQSLILSWVSGPMSFLGMGYPPARSGWGTPPARSGWGTPSAGSGWSTPPPQPGQDGILRMAKSTWGTPSPGQDGVPPGQVRMGYFPPPPAPKTEQLSKHLLRGRRCASCVHTGGLSCFFNVCGFYIQKRKAGD